MQLTPRWSILLADAIRDAADDLSPYTLATTGPSAVAHCRSIVHRASIAPLSPSNPLLLATTDIRSQKVAQATSAPSSELAWWFPKTQVQFRIAARLHIVPAKDHPSYSHFALSFGKLAPENFDWETERRNRFNSMSSYMRASWARPAPKSPIESYDEGEKWPSTLPEIGQGKDEAENEQIQAALSNFALILLEPHEVDFVELGIQPNQRTIFTRAGEGGSDDKWEESIVVP